MKKILLFMALVTLGVTTAGAQRLMTTANHPQKNKMEKMPVKQQIKSMAPVKKEGGKDLVIYNTKKISPAKVSPRRAEGDPELVAWYNIPTGAFYWGMTPEEIEIAKELDRINERYKQEALNAKSKIKSFADKVVGNIHTVAEAEGAEEGLTAKQLHVKSSSLRGYCLPLSSPT